MQLEERLRADIVEVGRRVHDRGFVASNDGNISVRLDGDRLLTTPTGVSKGFMTADMMVTTDLTGRKLTGDREPSSEILMHLAVYEHRPEVTAVVHAHPPTATGFAVAGIPLDRAVLAEVVTTLGSIPIADYGTPSTAELADAVRRHIRAHDGLLLANHGALTVAQGLFPAYYKMETVEHFEEDMTDKTRVHGPLKITIEIGESIEVAPKQVKGVKTDPLMAELEQRLTSMLQRSAAHPATGESPAVSGTETETVLKQ